MTKSKTSKMKEKSSKVMTKTNAENPRNTQV